MIRTVPVPRRAAACALACSLVWADLATLAQANTDIADTPMATRSSVKPNMIMALDDSGSMDLEVLGTTGFPSSDGSFWWHTGDRRFFGRRSGTPTNKDPLDQFVAGSGTTPPRGPLNFNYDGNPGNGTPWRTFIYLFPNGVCNQAWSSTVVPAGNECVSNQDLKVNNVNGNPYSMNGIAPTREFAWTRSHLYNAVYYNPAVNYDPWRPYHDGTALRTPVDYNNTGAGLWTAVRAHPHYPTPTTTGATINLTANVPMPGDGDDGNRLFRMYPGMIIPDGARYRSCPSGHNDLGPCSGWTNNTGERCIISSSTPANASACALAAAYSVTDTLNIGTWDSLMVQISYFPATYWVLSTGTGALAADEAWGIDGRRLRRIEIRPTVTSYAKAVARTDCAGATCKYAEEMTNFANWWAYYRKRSHMTNGALGLAFDQVRGLRGGFFAFSDRRNVTMYDFDNTDNAQNARRLLGQIYIQKRPRGTPTREAIDFAGQQFRRTDAGAPINAACQFNAAFIITDGFATPTGFPTTFGNVDASTSNRFTVPYSPNTAALNLTNATPPGTLPLPPLALPATTVTPAAPFRDDFSNTMADIAMHYYSTNLRPDYTGANFRLVPVDPNDLAPDADRNDVLHMNTYALGLGVQGWLFGSPDFPDQNRDPYAFPPDWHYTLPQFGGGFGNLRDVNRNPAAIDELWHATINGRGIMVSASSPEQTRSAIVDIVNNVAAKGGSGAAVGVANPNLVPGDGFSYASSYNSGSWSGDINKFTIDLGTGVASTTGVWSPSPQRLLAVRGHDTRIIATYHPTLVSASEGGGVPFRWASLSAGQQTALTPVPPALGTGPEVVNFLRGERSREVEAFRSRGPRPPFANNITPANIAVLGSIINAEPVVIGPPLFSYFDDGYAAFRTANATRPTTVYQGANDGMLHAFAGTDGSELWAYVPGLVFSSLRNLSDRTSFSHRYYVDGTPAVGDADLSFTNGFSLTSPPAPDWRTLLVGGLRKGGFGYYALDITNPSAGNETTLAQRVLWEFPNASMTAADRAKVGFSFGKPIIAKTRAAGWVVIVSSGYNNGTTGASGFSGGDGIGRIFVLNARTGALIREISTNTGSTTNASGLAHISAFTERPQVDATVEAVYGGDLLGNLWRFDLSGTTTASWAVTRIATVTDASGNIQPITVEPELSVVNRKRFIYFGTGQYLGDSDLPGNLPENVFARRRMSFYGIRDDLGVTGAGPVYAAPFRNGMVAQTITKGALTATLTSNPVPESSRGWFFDFTEDGERIVTNPSLSGGVITFTSNLPTGGTEALCRPGGRSWVWFVDFATGGRVTLDGSPTESGRFVGNVLSSRPVLVRLPAGNIVGLVRGSDAQTRTVDPPNNTAAAAGRRLSWREIVQ